MIGTSPDLPRIKLCVQGQDQIMMQCKNDFGFWNDIKVSTFGMETKLELPRCKNSAKKNTAL